MCNSLPPRAAHLQPVGDARSVVEGPRPRGEHDCNIFLTLTPLIGPWRPEDLSEPGIEPVSPCSCIAGEFFTSEPLGKHSQGLNRLYFYIQKRVGEKEKTSFFLVVQVVVKLLIPAPSSYGAEECPTL